MGLVGFKDIFFLLYRFRHLAINWSVLTSTMNGHSEAQILIVDAGAQYGKVCYICTYLN